MANPLLNNFMQMPQSANNQATQPQMAQMLQGGFNKDSLKQMLQNPQVKQQIRQMYRMFNGDTNALMQYLVQQNPALRNNQMLQMIMQSQNNPNGILGELGLNQKDFADIINGK